jgi:hypothetical protein
LDGIGFFFVKKAGWMLVKESGSSGTLFILLSLIRIDSRFSPSLSVDRCWKSEMLVPWKEVVAVVAVGLWSINSVLTFMINGTISILKS